MGAQLRRHCQLAKDVIKEIKKLNRLRIGQRLALGFSVVTALLILPASLPCFRIADLSGDVNLMVQDRYPKTVIRGRLFHAQTVFRITDKISS